MDTLSRDFLDVNGARLWVESRGDGPTIVFVHSGITDSRMWNPQWDAFPDFRLVRYDLRGYGQSPLPPGDYAHHDDLRAVLDALAIPRAVLIAASMGGEVALAFTLDHPDRVTGLVLVDTLAGIQAPSDHLRAGWRAMEEALDAGDLDRAVEIELGMWVDGPHRAPDEVDPSVRELVREMDLALLRRAAEHEHATGQDPNPPVRERLGDIRCPVLVVTGVLDVDDARLSAEALVTGIPDVRQAVIPDVAHLPSLEDPGRFNALVGEFLATLPRPTDAVG